MNIHTSFVLLAALAVASAVTISSANAEEFKDQGLPYACVGCNTDDSIAAAKTHLINDMPISVWTDKDEYMRDDIITLTGHVSNPVKAGTGASAQVTVMVKNSVGAIVTVDQIGVGDDKTFQTALNTGGKMWSSDGIYTIYVQHNQNTNKVQVALESGMADGPMQPPSATTPEDCASDQLMVVDMCVPYMIEGGVVTGTDVNTNDGALIIMIEPTDYGTLTLSPSNEVINGVFMILVDNEQSDDYKMMEDGTIIVWFGPEAEVVEIIGEYVIPEFGTIAVMILAAAIVSIIAVSARSRLSIVTPRV